MFRDDGSVESANSTNNDTMSQNEVSYDSSIYRCLVLDRYFSDSQLNITGLTSSPSMMYRVIVIGGFNDGKIIDNVRPANFFGGPYNNEDRVYRINTIKETQDLKGNDMDGDIVYVTFINQNIYDPVIIGCDTSPLDNKRSTATAEDGSRWTWEFNALRNVIDKAGKWIRTRFSGKANEETGEYEPDPENEVKIQVQETWEDGKTTKIVSDDAVTETTEGKDVEKHTRTMKSGLKVEQDGINDVMKITTKGNVVATFDGKSGKVTIDSDGSSVVEINKDGTVTVTANTKINLLAPEVDVGDSAALSSTLFEKLKQEFDKHTHQSNSILTPAPSSPPLVPLIDVVGSQTVKVND